MADGSSPANLSPGGLTVKPQSRVPSSECLSNRHPYIPPDPAQQQQQPQQQPPGTGRAGFTSSPQLSEARPAEAPPPPQQPPQQEVHVAEADAEAPGGATAAAPPPLGGDADDADRGAPSASPPSEGEMKTAEAAATKIQAGFRGYKVRRQLREQSQDQSVADGGDDSHGTDTGAASNGQGQHAGQQCRSVGVHHHDIMESGLVEPGLEGLDDELLQRSAARIQAGVRGFLVRRRQHNAAQAAAKIQAGFRGYRARRDLKQRVRVGKANPSRQ